jgi:hypothetical protein
MRLPILDVSYKLYALDQNSLERIYDKPKNGETSLQSCETFFLRNKSLIYEK